MPGSRSTFTTEYQVSGSTQPSFIKTMNEAAMKMGLLQTQLKDFQKQAGMAGLAANGIGTGFNRATREANALNASLMRASIAGSAIGNVIGNVVVSGLQSAVGLAQQLGREFVQFTKSSVDAAAAHELMQKGMANLIRNPAVANQIMEREQRIAIQSPFQAKDLQSMAKRFLAAGASPEMAMHMTEMGGNIVAGIGGNAEMLERFSLAMGKIQASGRMSGQEARELKDLGIPYQQTLMRMFNTDAAGLEKLQAHHLITSQAIVKMIDIMTGKGGQFEDGMKHFAETFTGISTSIADMVQQFEIHFGDILNDLAKPIGKFIVDNNLWNKMFNWLDDARKMSQGVTSFIATLSPGDTATAFKLFQQPFTDWNNWLHTFMHKVYEMDPDHPAFEKWHYELNDVAKAQVTLVYDHVKTLAEDFIKFVTNPNIDKAAGMTLDAIEKAFLNVGFILQLAADVATGDFGAIGRDIAEHNKALDLNWFTTNKHPSVAVPPEVKAKQDAVQEAQDRLNSLINDRRTGGASEEEIKQAQQDLLDAQKKLNDQTNANTEANKALTDSALSAATALSMLGGVPGGGGVGGSVGGGYLSDPGPNAAGYKSYESYFNEPHSSNYGFNDYKMGEGDYHIGPAAAAQMGLRKGSWVHTQIGWGRYGDASSRGHGIEVHTHHPGIAPDRLRIDKTAPGNEPKPTVQVIYNIQALDHHGIREVLKNHGDQIAQAVHKHFREWTSAEAVV